MNWLDWTIIALLAWAAIKGFQRGFIVELAALVALVLGIWAGTHLSERVGEGIGLDKDQVVIAFVITFLLVLVGVHLLARFLTTLVDLAQLSLPNKVAGIGFGMVRAAFSLSIALNLLLGYTGKTMPPQDVCEASVLYTPVQAFAPVIIPALGETKWVKDAVERAKDEAERLAE
jgi:membrane protein required for colicin V production